jgi:hypothetical protein
MNSDRGWYLVALGVLALGISNSSVGDSARGFFDRAAVLADHLSVETVRAFAVAQLMSDRGDPGWANAQAAWLTRKPASPSRKPGSRRNGPC